MRKMILSKTYQLVIQPYHGFSKTTWKLVGAGFVNATGLVISIYISLYLNSLGYLPSQIGYSVALLGLGGLVGGYLGGVLIDQFNPVLLCKLSLLATALLLFLFPLHVAAWYFDVICLFLGLVIALFRPAFMLALAEDEHTVPLERIIALRRVAINLGSSLGAFLFGLIVIFGYLPLFWTSMVLNLIALFLMPKIFVKNVHVATDASNERHLPSNRTMYQALFLMLCALLVFNQTRSVYPIYLEGFVHLDVRRISYLFAISSLFIVLFQMPITSWLAQFGSKKNCIIGSTLICFGFAVLPLLKNSYFLIIASCIIWTIGEIIFFPEILKFIILVSPFKKGKTMGVYQFFFSLASMLAPLLGTYFYEINPNLVWLICGCVGFAFALALMLALKDRKIKVAEDIDIT